MTASNVVVLSDLLLGPRGIPVNGPTTCARLSKAVAVILPDHAAAAFALAAGTLSGRGGIARRSSFGTTRRPVRSRQAMSG